MGKMEGALGVEKAQGPEWKEGGGGSSAGELEVKAEVTRGDQEWLKELERAVGEVILIVKLMKDRARKLGLSWTVETSSTCVDQNKAQPSWPGHAFENRVPCQTNHRCIEHYVAHPLGFRTHTEPRGKSR